MSLLFSSVEKIEKDGITQIIKRAHEDELETTADQINYLLNLPEGLQEFFPTILEYKIGNDKVWYTMPFYSMQSLDCALYQNHVSIDDLKIIFSSLINIMFDKIYIRNICTVPCDYIKTIHFNRIEKRIKYLYSKRPDLTSLIYADIITVNGIKYRNVLALLNEIQQSSLLEKLNPQFLGFIHGDLETNHILFDINDNKVDFIFLDPRMPLNGGDYTYDMGKLWQSIDGEVTNLIQGLFNLSFDMSNQEVNAKFKINRLRPVKELNELKKFVLDIVSNKKFILNDNNWYYRCLFSQAAHFLSAPPFFMDKNHPEKLAEAMYLTGVIKLNTLYNDYLKEIKT
jgi:hypothetical protein